MKPIGASMLTIDSSWNLLLELTDKPQANDQDQVLCNWVFTEFEQADKKSSGSSNELDTF
jgi:hypothetical protein